MQAIVMRETGDPDVLRLEEIERPEPADGEVLIRVHAASVNPIDWKQRRGVSDKQLPAVLGIDVSGTVEVSRSDDFVLSHCATPWMSSLVTVRPSSCRKRFSSSTFIEKGSREIPRKPCFSASGRL